VSTPKSAREKRLERAARRAAKDGHAEAAVTTPKKTPAKRIEDLTKAEVIAAGSSREIYLAYLRSGMTVSEVARKCGVSRQAVHKLTVGHDRARAELDQYWARRRGVTPNVTYKCSICDEIGHNAANPDFHPKEKGKKR